MTTLRKSFKNSTMRIIHYPSMLITLNVTWKQKHIFLKWYLNLNWIHCSCSYAWCQVQGAMQCTHVVKQNLFIILFYMSMHYYVLERRRPIGRFFLGPAGGWLGFPQPLSFSIWGMAFGHQGFSFSSFWAPRSFPWSPRSSVWSPRSSLLSLRSSLQSPRCQSPW